MRNTTLAILAAGACVALPLAAFGRAQSGLSPLDKTFIKQTAQSNIGELKYRPLVDKMAQRPASRQFARRMVQDHTKAELELEELATRLHTPLPKDTDQEEKVTMRRLAREPKSRFDAAYKHEMIRDHTEDIARTRREISLGRNPEVKAYARKMLPVLETHLALAQALPATAARGTTASTGNAGQTGGSGASAATTAPGTTPGTTP